MRDRVRFTRRSPANSPAPDRGETTLADTRDTLRVASDTLLRDLEILETLEEQKRSLDLTDPLVGELAERIENLARRVLAASAAQRTLTVDARTIADATPAGTIAGSIDTTPRAAHEILTEWRAAERRLTVAIPGSAEALELSATIDALREEYRRAFEAAKTPRQG